MSARFTSLLHEKSIVQLLVLPASGALRQVMVPLITGLLTVFRRSVYIDNGTYLEHGTIAILLPSPRRRYGRMLFLFLSVLSFITSESSLI